LVRLGIGDHLAGPFPAIVILDDLEPAGLEALTRDVLDRIRCRAVIAATMTAQRRATVVNTSNRVTAVARAALASASGEYELASGPPAGAEKAQAELLYPREQFDGSIAETLAGARELIARYKAAQDSNPAGCAVVRAAIDARRAGVSRPLTEAELRRLFPPYLQAVRVGVPDTREQFAKGLEWASQPVVSQVALLRRDNSGWVRPAWTVFDHAVSADDGYGGYHPRPVPAGTWTELVEMLSPGTFSRLG
jgi:hypothetical protein